MTEQITLSWCWQHRGEPESLIKESKLLPKLQPDEVLIENKVIGLNPVDWKLIEWGHDRWQAGQVPGVDAMGVVCAVGSAAGHIRIGTRVCYHTNLQKHGSFSQHTVVSAKALMAVPDQLSDEAAAAFPCPGLTAWQAMKKIPELSGKKVLVSGAGGSVGQYLIQLLLKAGAKVYATASVSHHKQLRQWGVIEVFDYKDPHLNQAIEQALHGCSLYAAFDMVSGESARTLVPLLGYYGHLVCVQDRLDIAPQPAFTTCISFHEIALGAIHQYGSDKQWVELIKAGEQMLQCIACGALKQVEIDIGDFDSLPQKLFKLKTGNTGKKFLIKI